VIDSSATAQRAPAAIAPEPSGRENWRKPARSILVTAVPAALWLAPLPLDVKSHHAIAICAFMILGWVTEVLDHGLTGLIGCYLFWALGVVRFDVAFSGFANDSAWFALAAMVFGIMGTKSGLARRLAYRVMLRIGTTYSRILLALILADFLLTFLIPNGLARVVILAPVALGFIEALGLAPGSNIGRGMILILTYTAGVFDKTIIAGTAAITARGLIETLGHAQVLWSRWFLAYLPSDILIILAAWRITLWLFPAERASVTGGISFLREELQKLGRWTTTEKKSLVLILAASALWMTDFLHHLPPSLICIGVALLAVLPVTGVLKFGDLKLKYILLFFFVASALSMGEVLKATKTLDVLANTLFTVMGPLLVRPYLSSFVLYWTGFICHIFLGSEVSMLGMSMPVLMNFAHAHGLNALALGLIWTFSSGGKIFVYQSAVLIGGYSYGYFEPKDLLRLGLCMSIVDSIQLLLLAPLYWPLIGIGTVVTGN
jgi:solute carrier family 13 (sodium-dependent dicarboxylate transporter), member 2/3/5